MMLQSSTAFDWTTIVDYDLLDPDRIRLGTVAGILPGDGASESLARVVRRGSVDDEFILPVSMIGIVGERWAMLDQSIATIQSSIQHMHASAA